MDSSTIKENILKNEGIDFKRISTDVYEILTEEQIDVVKLGYSLDGCVMIVNGKHNWSKDESTGRDIQLVRVYYIIFPSNNKEVDIYYSLVKQKVGNAVVKVCPGKSQYESSLVLYREEEI